MYSCANFIKNIDDDLLTQKSVPYKKISDKKTYCSTETNFTLISDSKDSQMVFSKFINDYKFNYADKLVLWTFVQMNLRPDLTGPNSKLQIFLNYNGREDYYHFYTKETKQTYPLFYGLEYILKKYQSRYGLLKLANIFDNKYPNRFFVSEAFATFLEDNIKEISADKNLKRYFTRAEEPLREGERIYKQKLSPFIKMYLKSKKSIKYVKNDYLFEYKRNNLIKAKCNYDMSLYNSSIYLINDKFIKSNMFGMRENSNLFLSATTQSLKKLISLKNSIYFKSDKTRESAAMCSFKSQLNN
jgi:hypothetical protein